MQRRRYLAGLATLTTVSVAGCSGGDTDDSTDEEDTGTATPTFDPPFEREIDPARTYLRTNDDDAGDARPIDIGSRNIRLGSTIRLVRRGQFTGSSGGMGMTGVFSGSSTLESSDVRERVPDAIDAGEDFETSATFNGGLETDVPEDFRIADNEGEQTSVTVTVPDGATHLFVAAIDNFYEDNGQGESPFTIRIENA
jgi:hypothetical protein